MQLLGLSSVRVDIRTPVREIRGLQTEMDLGILHISFARDLFKVCSESGL